MAYIKLGDTYPVGVPTQTSLGEAVNPDSLTVTVYEDGTLMGYSPTIVNLDTGESQAALVCSTGNGFEVGKSYAVWAAATVGSKTSKAWLGSFGIVAQGIDDLPTSTVMVDALLATAIETGVSLKAFYRIIGAVMAGQQTGGLAPAFAALGDPSKIRVSGTVTDDGRIILILDGSD